MRPQSAGALSAALRNELCNALLLFSVLFLLFSVAFERQQAARKPRLWMFK